MIISMVQLQVFLLILARVASMLTQVPLFGDRTVNRSTRMVLVLSLSVLIWTVISFNVQYLPTSGVMLVVALIREAFIGFVIGMAVRIVFAGVEAAGELMGSQMGLSVATLLDPSLGQQSVITSRFLRFVVIVIFLIIDGHHLILAALVRSFSALGLGLVPLNVAEGSFQIVEWGAQIFAIALSLSAPILMVIFLLDFAFGLISRVSPQVNVFMLGFQLKPPLGMFIFLVTIPYLTDRIVYYLGQILQQIARLLVAMS